MKKCTMRAISFFMAVCMLFASSACALKPEDAADRIKKLSEIDFNNTKGFQAESVITYLRKNADGTEDTLDEWLRFETISTKKQRHSYLYSKRLNGAHDVTVGQQNAEQYYNVSNIFYYNSMQFRHIKYSQTDAKLVEGYMPVSFDKFRSDFQGGFERVMGVYDPVRWLNIEVEAEDGYTIVRFEIEKDYLEDCFAFIASRHYGSWEFIYGPQNVFSAITSAKFEYKIKSNKIVQRTVSFVGDAMFHYLTDNCFMTYTTVFGYDRTEPQKPTSAMFDV